MRTDPRSPRLHRQHRRPAAALLALTVVGLLSGCLANADTRPKAGPGTVAYAQHNAVRVGTHTAEDGFDRVVFQFVNGVPPWDVRYVPKPILGDGSGLPIALAGNHAVQVRMSPASGWDFETGTPVYTGPSRIYVGAPEVTEVVRSGDFEAVLTWNIGTRHQVPFRVTTLTAPPRLVVDLAHG